MRKSIILYVSLIALVSILALEGLVRMSQRGPRWLNSTYVKISEDFPDLEALLADLEKTSLSPKYYDEFLYAARPASSTHINFTDYFSARLTPDSVALSVAEHIVWTFGGSTMENTETSDENTIANTLAKRFTETLGPTHVKNFGAGGFTSSFELIKFQKLLRDVPHDELPNIVIFYDGYNDALYGFQYGPGTLQKDLSLKLEALVEHDDLRLSIYSISRMISKYSRLWDRTGARLVNATMFPLGEPIPELSDLDGVVRVYLSNVKMGTAICDTFRIRCFFVLQPLVLTKKPLTSLEQEVLSTLENHSRFGPSGTIFMQAFYEKVRQELAGEDYFIDASSILDGRSQSDFYDLGHTAAQTSPIIGEKIADMVRIRLDNIADSSTP
jgi:hypothetical protein